MEYLIPQENLARLREKLEKLNKKAKKLGVEPIRLEVLPEPVDEVNEETGEVSRSYRVLVEGEAPSLNGWEFVATINHLEEANLLRAVPGKEIPRHFRDVPSWCQHCKQSRKRNDTYVVRKIENDEHLQVGSSCLRDFLGHPDPHGYARWAEYLAEFDEFARSMGERGESGGYQLFDLEHYLYYVSAVIREDGWVSRKMASDSYGERTATADIAWNFLTNRNIPENEKPEILDEDRKLVSDAIEFKNRRCSRLWL